MIGKPKGRAISTAFCGSACSSVEAIAAGKLPCSALSSPAILFADVADPACAAALRANVKSASKLKSKAAKSSSANLISSLSRTSRPRILAK